jgi:putative peptide zinc metalloprotease protein
LGLLYVGFLISKLLHEMSHAAACKRFGGEVHKLGVMLLIFAPMPYVDATSAWGFRHRRERLLVGLAGVLAELALAAVAALIWAHTAPGTLNALAYNVMFVASVSTLVFNLNPLLRFDGYHIAVDLFDMPNLYQRSREQLRYLGEMYLLRLRHAQPVARTSTEAVLLPLYGVSSILYWMLLMSTIIFFIAGEYLDLGVALALMMFFTSVVLPLYKFIQYLSTNPQLGYHRGRAIAVSVGSSVLALGILFGIPLPDQVRVTGIVEARQSRELHAESEGFFVDLLVRPGSHVQAGQALLRLENPLLAFDILATQMQLEQIQAQEIQALSRSLADLAALARQREAVEKSLADLQRREQALLVKAPIDGIWSASELDASRGQWLGRGAAMGTVLNPDTWRFVAVLPQVGSHIFDDQIKLTEVRLKGQEGVNLKAEKTTVLPFEQGQLPSRALGMPGGGDLAVLPSDPQGLTAAEPFFRIEAALPALPPEDLLLVHGRIGTMRLTLSNRPLGLQWERRLRQFFQRRFRV